MENDPIELLKQSSNTHSIIKSTDMTAMLIVYDAITTLFGTKQKEHESLQDYTK
jgi:hypothetical protein